MVICIFRGIRGTSLCAEELWLFIYSELLGALLSVLMSYGYLYIQRYWSSTLCADELWLFIYSVVFIRSNSLRADELWLFICSEVLGALLSVLMSYGYLYVQRY